MLHTRIHARARARARTHTHTHTHTHIHKACYISNIPCDVATSLSHPLSSSLHIWRFSEHNDDSKTV